MQSFHRVYVGNFGAHFHLAPCDTAGGASLGACADGQAFASRCCDRVFALQGAPADAVIHVAPLAVVWARRRASDATMLVGERARAHDTRATVSFVTHAVTATGWRVDVMSNVEPPWRPRHARPFAFALPRDGSSELLALAAAGAGATAEEHAAAQRAHDRARLPADVRHVADYVANKLYDADDSESG